MTLLLLLTFLPVAVTIGKEEVVLAAAAVTASAAAASFLGGVIGRKFDLRSLAKSTRKDLDDHMRQAGEEHRAVSAHIQETREISVGNSKSIEALSEDVRDLVKVSKETNERLFHLSGNVETLIKLQSGNHN